MSPRSHDVWTPTGARRFGASLTGTPSKGGAPLRRACSKHSQTAQDLGDHSHSPKWQLESGARRRRAGYASVKEEPTARVRIHLRSRVVSLNCICSAQMVERMACGRKQFTEPWQVCREFSEAGQLHKPPHQIITARKDPAEDVLLAFERQGNGSTRSSLARSRAQNGMSRIIAS